MPTVYASTLIPASIERVWTTIRDFNALPTWHPLIAQSRIEGYKTVDQVGCIRAFRLKDGDSIREQLLALSDFEYSLTYSILESPMPVTNYLARIQLMPLTDSNSTFAEWSAEFSCPSDQTTTLVELVEKRVFQGGLTALKERFGG
ncbi:MAG: SRPBCC family protein [Gammaproteobacteria bacterium]|nr:SRPBCC family protein [Gammaproteobacteria bacterium]MCY4218591.1 SRPBCC family protein [Gammaproteobacteria bacterium]MCY4275901.1 SRPBCC family protein [Gammaproteobacteria bacterium]